VQPRVRERIGRRLPETTIAPSPISIRPYVEKAFDREAFFGFYPIRHHEVKIKGTAHPVYDLMGKEASLFRYTVYDGSPVGAQYVAQARQWFTTVWETISREFTG
jgi:hypothetical protein